LTMTRR